MDELDQIETWAIPGYWSYAKLEDVGCGENAIVDGPFGSNLKVSDYIDDSVNGVPVLTTKNLEGDYSERSVRYISQNKYEELKRSKVQSGDILVAKIGSIGKTGIYPIGMKTGIIPANLLKFTVTPSVEFKYVFAYLNCLGFQQFIKLISTATAQPAFNVTKFRKLPIPLPPFNEQHRIVAKIEELFSELDKGIENLKTAQAQLKVYRQALLKHAFEGKLTAAWREQNRDQLETAEALLARIQTERAQRYQQQLAEWKTHGGSKPKAPKPLPPLTDEELVELPELPEGWVYSYLADLGDLGRGKSKHRPRNDSRLFGGAYPFVQTGEVKVANRIIREYSQTYSNFGLQQSKLWPAGTLCITIAANIAETAFLGFDGCFPDSVVGFSAFTNVVSPEYVDFFIQATRTRIEAYAPATAQKNINLETLEKLVVPYCGEDEQQQILNILEERFSEIDQLDQSITTSLQQAEALRQSILKKAFSGQLVPQDPGDEPAAALLARIKAENVQHAEKSKKARLRSTQHE